MAQSTELINTLKKLLKAKGLMYQDIARALDLSLPSVKRLFSHGDLSLSRLDQICELAGIELTDLLKLMEVDKSQATQELTEDQEAFLSSKPQAMAYLELLFLGYRPKDIQEEYGLSIAQTHKYLKALEEKKLIDWLPQDRVKLKIEKMIRLRPGSALVNLLREKGVNSLLRGEFQGSDKFQEFMTFKASPKTIKQFNAKMRTALQELSREGILEDQVGVKVDGYAISVALRPWRLVELTGLK